MTESLEDVVRRVITGSESVKRIDGEIYTSHAVTLAADLAVAFMRWANEQGKQDD